MFVGDLRHSSFIIAGRLLVLAFTGKIFFILYSKSPLVGKNFPAGDDDNMLILLGGQNKLRRSGSV